MAIVAFVGFRSIRSIRTSSQQKTLAALNRQASTSLLEAETDMSRIQLDVDLAAAEYGIADTSELRNRVLEAQDNLSQAFEIKRLLHDEHPETPAEARRMNKRILELTRSTKKLLDNQNATLEQLRSLVPNQIATAEEQIAAAKDRFGAAERALEALDEIWTETEISKSSSLLSDIKTQIQKATKLLDSARQSSAEADARTALVSVNSCLSTIQRANTDLAAIWDQLANNRVPNVLSANPPAGTISTVMISTVKMPIEPQNEVSVPSSAIEDRYSVVIPQKRLRSTDVTLGRLAGLYPAKELDEIWKKRDEARELVYAKTISADAARMANAILDEIDARWLEVLSTNPTTSQELTANDSNDEATVFVDNATIRKWARQNGYDVAAKGKIPQHILRAYAERVES